MTDEIKHIVRIANTDVAGTKPLYLSLQKIKGVGENFSRAVCVLAKIDYMTITGTISDKQVEAIEKVLANPEGAGVPKHFLNRLGDYETGEDMHLFTADLDYAKDQDIKKLRKIKSYRGLRHHWRLPLRGQRTGSNFRPNKGKGGAVKKKSTTRK